jgi:hypothetical protein
MHEYRKPRNSIQQILQHMGFIGKGREQILLLADSSNGQACPHLLPIGTFDHKRS